MISVEKGEIYWSIILDEDDEPCAIPYVNEGTHIDIGRLTSKNSFNTREEAEVVVRKLRAVLDGADVIEMPSEHEIKKTIKGVLPIIPVAPWCVEGYCKYIVDWLKSKIVK